MPTGYTAAVQDGKATFGQFVWSCARAFGALIMMREDPMDAPIPEFKPSPFYREWLERNEAEIAKLEALTPGELEALFAQERREAIQANAEHVRRHEESRERYEAMLRQVEAWEAPTNEHAGLKKFMIDQLKDSLEHDCGFAPYQRPVPTAPGDWLAERLSSLRGELPRMRQSLAEEIERTNERNRWVSELKSSVPYERPGT